MDIGLREVLILIGLLIISAVLLDGFRRVRQAKRPNLKMDLDLSSHVEGDPFNAELPNGGARTSCAHAGSEQMTKADTQNEKKASFLESVPSFDSPRSVYRDRSTVATSSPQPARPVSESAAQKVYKQALAGHTQKKTSVQLAEQPVAASSVSSSASITSKKKAQNSPHSPHSPQEVKPQEVLIINIMAKSPDKPFTGDLLLKAILGNGLRFGDMNIFHYYETVGTGEKTVFSLANCLEPGTFDLTKMNDFATTGVCLFMTLPASSRGQWAFELMLTVAHKLADILDADLKDSRHKRLTQRTLEGFKRKVQALDENRTDSAIV